jgi:type IV secretory pathway VirB10-like protein
MTFHLANKQALLLALGGLALVAAFVWATWEPGLPAPPDARAPGVAGVSSTPGGPQTPEYARLQKMADSTRANSARASGGSAVPTPPELRPFADGAPPANAPPATDLATVRAAPVQTPPAASAPDEMERWVADFARAMQDQTRQLVEFRKRFEPDPTRMVAFEDIKGQRERADAQKRAEELLAGAHAARPRDQRGVLQPGDILFAVLQTAIDSDEPGPVRAKIVGERFKDAILLGGLRAFPPAVGSRPERVLVKFDYLTTADRATYRIDAFAIDLATARTALATDVDHHYLDRWGSLLAASFLEGYGNAIKNNNRITAVGPLGNVVSVPKGDLSHDEITREALGTVGQRLGSVVAENFQRPNTITVDPGTGLGILIAAPLADRPEVEDRRGDERGRAASAGPRTRAPLFPTPGENPQPQADPAVVFPPVSAVPPTRSPPWPARSGRSAPDRPAAPAVENAFSDFAE